MAGGYQEVYERQYDKVFAPVVDFTVSVFILLITLDMGWSTRHVDVMAAQLNGDIDCLIHIMFPYILLRKKRGKVYALHRTLFGLKEAPLRFTNLRDCLNNKMGSKQLKTDCSVFFKMNDNGDVCIILA